MTDIFQEVEEDLRREKLKRLWDRYGIFVIAAAVLVVVVTAGYRGFVAWDTARSEAAGDRFAAAIGEAGGPAEAAALEEIADDGPAGYALLARFRLASEEAGAGEAAAAVATLEAIAADGGVPELYRELARVRAGLILIDAGDFSGAEQKVAALAETDAGPFTFAAREVMGLAAYAEGDLAAARRWFADLEGDPAAPAGLRGRARLMLLLVEGRMPAAASPGENGAGTGGGANGQDMTQ